MTDCGDGWGGGPYRPAQGVQIVSWGINDSLYGSTGMVQHVPSYQREGYEKQVQYLLAKVKQHGLTSSEFHTFDYLYKQLITTGDYPPSVLAGIAATLLTKAALERED